MLSPVGLPPPLSLPREPELLARADRAIAVPVSVGTSARWEVGSVLSATVRFQGDEMMLKVGDQFFSSRPIPGVSEYSRLSLQVSRDMSGALTLIPLLPLAGTTVARIGGAPSPAGRVFEAEGAAVEEVPNLPEMPTSTAIAAVSRMGGSPTQALSSRLQLPSALSGWLLGTLSAARPAIATAVPAGLAEPAPLSPSGWMHSLASTLSNSGLFFESQLRERRPISTSDLKRRLLEVIDARREGPAVDDAWAALDDLVGLQSAATAAHRSGGTVVSFVMTSPDGLGGWWITLQQDPAGDLPDYRGGDGRRDDHDRPWRTRLVGIRLPFGEIDIRIEQVGKTGIGVTVLTDTADQGARWEDSRQELSRRLQDAQLELARWAVIEPHLHSKPPTDPGRLQSIRV
jgi:hypothetical protein